MDDRIEKAEQLHDKGYSCSQAVMTAFAGEMGLDEKTAYRLAEGFSGGCGMGELCGAFAGLTAVLGYKASNGQLDGPNSKRETGALIRRASALYKEKYGSVVCREILQNHRNGCGEKVRDAAAILSQMLAEIENK